MLFIRGSFVTRWDLYYDDLDRHSLDVRIPLEPDGVYNFTVDWGDGTINKVTSWNSTNKTHTYSSGGSKIVTITGKIRGFNFAFDSRFYGLAFLERGMPSKLWRILSWGPLELGNNGGYFKESRLADFNFDLKLRDTTNLSYAFSGYNPWSQGYYSLNHWDLSNVTNMEGMFYDAHYLFTPTISNWDVSNVRNMERMFGSFRGFNDDISSWDVSNVRNMNAMFKGATRFNQNISDWKVSGSADMREMFSGATSFNQNLSGWGFCHLYAPLDFSKGVDNWREDFKPFSSCPPSRY